MSQISSGKATASSSRPCAIGSLAVMLTSATNECSAIRQRFVTCGLALSMMHVIAVFATMLLLLSAPRSVRLHRDAGGRVLYCGL